MRMRQKVVGNYLLGAQMVQLVLREGTGGEFFVVPGDIPYPRIKVGADQETWTDVVAVVIHEAAEQVAANLLYRWEPTNDDARDSLSVLFVMTHPQFSEVCSRTAGFLTACLPDLSRAWKQWKKEVA